MWNQTLANFNLPLWLVLVASVLSFKILRSIYNNIRHARNARRLGARDPPLVVNRLPLGIDFLRRLLRASAEGRFPDEMATVYQDGGAKTLKHRFLGRTVFHTIEPKNLQAMLATQFSDFSLSHSRDKSFRPMLGRGIFTANGRYWSVSFGIEAPFSVRANAAAGNIPVPCFAPSSLGSRLPILTSRRSICSTCC